MLTPGDPAPWFVTKSSVNPKFHFDTVAGRYVILSFFGSSTSPAAQRLLKEVHANQRLFDVTNLLFCGVSNDPSDESRLAASPIYAGILMFADFGNTIARGYGLLDTNVSPARFHPTTFVLDEGLRVLAVVPLSGDGVGHIETIANILRQLPPLQQSPRIAPVLVLDRVFEPELCRRLVGIYEASGGQESGFMRDIDGKTTGIVDYSFKRRADCEITDQGLIRELHLRINGRIVPEIRKAFNFHVTRIERHIVACYDAAAGGHFRPHRDNTSLGTAHRRFAVSINLNAESFEGGYLRFPEFGPRLYRPSTGGAVVFGCSLLHEATPVTKGKRYAFLPFLYDDAAAAIREQNKQHLSAEFINLNREPDGA
ncbi:MAG: 2OG-Fe(II) oxygenase [Planctomycetota bacterium]